MQQLQNPLKDLISVQLYPFVTVLIYLLEIHMIKQKMLLIHTILR